MLIKRFSTLKAFIKTPHKRVELAGKAGPAEELQPELRGWTESAPRFAIKDGFKGRQEGSERWKPCEIQRGYPWKPWIFRSEDPPWGPALRNKSCCHGLAASQQHSRVGFRVCP